jgi:hypothetical protein
MCACFAVCVRCRSGVRVLVLVSAPCVRVQPNCPGLWSDWAKLRWVVGRAHLMASSMLQAGTANP